MCDLLVDVAVEAGSFTVANDDAVPVTCETGRVVLAASAWFGSTSGGWPIPASLADGTLSDTVTVLPQGAGAGHGTTVHYCLTTGRVATL